MSTHARARRSRRDGDHTHGDHRVERDQRRAERREALLDAAADVIRRRGSAASMEELAAAGGVTKPILYRHFGDRSGLVLALADRFAAGLIAELQTELAAEVNDPRETFVRAIDTFLRFIERDKEVYRFLVQWASAGEPETAVALGGFLRRIGQDVAVVLGEQFRETGHDAGGAEPLAHGIVGFVYGAGDWWAERQSMSRARLVEYLATALWSGFGGMLVVDATEEAT
jgi:AcrR family transcriptional regulator